jgi:HD-like signal output (HDOD) protein
MGSIRVGVLKPGMVLSDDVRDVKGRLLLGKGKPVTTEHIRIFKMWGIPQVAVAGAPTDAAALSPQVDPQRLEAVARDTEPLFARTDRSHPAVGEIFRLAVDYRAAHPSVSTAEPPPESVSPLSTPKTDFLEQFIARDLALPEIPSIVFELNEVIANPLSTADQMARVINKSPSLTALLLKIVNSSFYGLPSKVDRVSLAVTLIGTRELSALALGISIISVFKSIPRTLLNMQSFLQHSLGCAIIARLLAAQKGLRLTEQMFTAGLLHDIGRLILFIHFPSEILDILRRARRESGVLVAVEQQQLGCDHTAIGRYLLNHWRLPLMLENTVAFHHTPADAPDPVPAAIVHVADILVNALGVGTSGEHLVPPLDARAWEALELPAGTLEVAVRQALNHLDTLAFLLERPT